MTMSLSNVCRVCGNDSLPKSELMNIFEGNDQDDVPQQVQRCLPVLICEDDTELSLSICVSCRSTLKEVNAFFDLCEEGLERQIDVYRSMKLSPLDRQTHLDQYRRSFLAPIVPKIKLETSNLYHDPEDNELNDENEPLNILYDEPYVGDEDFSEFGESQHEEDGEQEYEGNEEKVERKRTRWRRNIKRTPKRAHDDQQDDKKETNGSFKTLSTCSKCGHVSADADSNVKHWQQDHPGLEVVFKCQEDGCFFTAKVAELVLKHKHKRSRKSDKAQPSLVPCPVCHKRYPPSYLHTRHMLVHSDTKAFECSECGKAFKTQADLKVHAKVHLPPDERYTHCCELCGKRFTQKANLEAHLRCHKGLKPYECDFCGNLFSQKGNLEEHRRIHTGEKPFVCESCGSAFARRSELHLHKRCAHTGERPFQCAYCPKNFQRRDLLRKHERIHTDTRPYQCKFCNKAFTQRDKLVVHTRLHTGERPYVCEVCGKGFCESGNLKKHLRVHGKEAPSVLHQNNKGKPAPGAVMVKMDAEAQPEAMVPVASDSLKSDDGVESPLITTTMTTAIALTTTTSMTSASVPIVTTAEYVTANPMPPMLESETPSSSSSSSAAASMQLRSELARPQNLTQYVVHPFVHHLQGIRDMYGQGP